MQNLYNHERLNILGTAPKTKEIINKRTLKKVIGEIEH
jgi:hypothetical protein